ncbi:MAG: N-6 DNA methylase [Anaerolineae bacterium]|nr:N-6 DNA methylase [Anaerolineae bacterium]
MIEPLSARIIRQLFGKKSQIARRVIPEIYDAIADQCLSPIKPTGKLIDWCSYGKQFGIEDSSPSTFLAAIQVYYASVALWLGAEHIQHQTNKPYQWEDVCDSSYFQDARINNLDVPGWMQKALLAAAPVAYPHWTTAEGDILKHLYQDLIPRELRHAQGAYYTADWLADYMIQQVGYDGQQTLLDPACGSGTFLVTALRHAMMRGVNGRDALSQLAGIDTDLLAVLAAKVNLLINLPDITGDLTLPIYAADALYNDQEFTPFDVVAGNPPWVNWQHLDEKYRDKTRDLWHEYGLFTHQGMEQILGKGKKDFATLFTCVVVDRYLKDEGQLAFLLSRSTLKSGGAGAGFRHYLLKHGPLHVKSVDDVSQITSFGGTKLDTIALFAEKTCGEHNSNAINYALWRSNMRRKRLEDVPLKTIFAMTTRYKMLAQPITHRDPSSPWLSAPEIELTAIQKLTGTSPYDAHAGVYTGGANGVYWLEIVENREETVLVRNLPEHSKKSLQSITAEIETNLVYPLLRGNDVQRWQAKPSAHILMVQDPQQRRGYDEAWLREAYPLTYGYLLKFKPTLLKRAAYKRYFRDDAPFYTMFDVAMYSFAPYKVVWQGIGAQSVQAAVCSPFDGLPVMTNQAMHPFVGLEDADEAHYLAACLNSLPFEYALLAHSQAGSQSFAQAGMLNRLHVPAYNKVAALHRDLAAFSYAAHEGDIGSGLDDLAAHLWSITPTELEAMRQSIHIWRK